MKPTRTRAITVVVACIIPGLLLACSSTRPSGGSFVEASSGAGSASSSSGTLSAPAKVCEADQTLCADGDTGGCVDTRTSSRHCGECGHVCAATEHCQDSACVALTCRTGMVPCMSECADIVNDSTNCGSCGHRCSTGERCALGACTLQCPAGTVICAGKCVEPNADPAHCGATTGCGESGGSAGVACGAASSCFGGQCVSDCADGLDACSTGCVDFRHDDANCGGCGSACGPGRHCSDRICCALGESACMGICRDTTSDPSACGGCGTVCADGEQCIASVCAP